MGAILFAIGAILALVGGIMMLIKAFKESIGWGIGSLIIPFVLLIFAFMHWEDCKKGFLIWLIGFVLYIVGFVMGGVELAGSMPQSR